MTLVLDKLGLTEGQKECLITALQQPQGLILVTGPTGSGKTITLYTALNYLNGIDKNISSVEDPVEIELPGINQVNVNTRIGLNFPTTLRAFLRQDPDVIMNGRLSVTKVKSAAPVWVLEGARTAFTVVPGNSFSSSMYLSILEICIGRYCLIFSP